MLLFRGFFPARCRRGFGLRTSKEPATLAVSRRFGQPPVLVTQARLPVRAAPSCRQVDRGDRRPHTAPAVQTTRGPYMPALAYRATICVDSQHVPDPCAGGTMPSPPWPGRRARHGNGGEGPLRSGAQTNGSIT